MCYTVKYTVCIGHPENGSHCEKWVTLTKMCRSVKNVLHCEIGIHFKNGSHYKKWVNLEKASHCNKWVTV